MWSNYPPEPVPIDDLAPAKRPAPEPAAARPSRLLPVVQCLAEGGWLAVLAAAIQAVFGAAPVVGPLEFAILAGFGMAWARRRSWRGPAGEAFGLPILTVVAGAGTWLISTDVRVALLGGDPVAALASHPGGWVGALAFLRGHAHHDRSVDEEVQDRLLRWGLPTVGVAWLVGHLAAARSGPGVLEAFTSVAFIGSVLFVSCAVLALGLARLATVRGEGAGSGSWFGFVLVVALGLTLVAIPAGVLLGVPAEALLLMLLAPIRVIGAVLVLLLSPVVAAAALVIDLAREILPQGVGLGTIELPRIDTGVSQPTSSLPGILFYLAIGLIIALELAAVALYLWWRWRERREMDALLREVAEERSVVFDRPPRPPRASRPAPPPRLDRADPAHAYLLALAALQRDDRWARLPSETPRQHLARVGSSLPGSTALARLAAAYQLVRYGGVHLTPAEQQRAAGRLARVELAARSRR